MYFLDYRNTCRTKSSADDLRLSDNDSKINNTTADRVKHHSTRSVSDCDGDSARDDSGDSVCDNSDDPRTFDSLEANEAYSRVVHSVKLPTRRESVDSEDSEQESSWIQSAEHSGNELEGEETGKTTKEDVPKKPPRMYISFVLLRLLFFVFLQLWQLDRSIDLFCNMKHVHSAYLRYELQYDKYDRYFNISQGSRMPFAVFMRLLLDGKWHAITMRYIDVFVIM